MGITNSLIHLQPSIGETTNLLDTACIKVVLMGRGTEPSQYSSQSIYILQQDC